MLAYARAIRSGLAPGNGGGGPVKIKGWTCQGFATPVVLQTGKASKCARDGVEILEILPPPPSPPPLVASRLLASRLREPLRPRRAAQRGAGQPAPRRDPAASLATATSSSVSVRSGALKRSV